MKKATYLSLVIALVVAIFSSCGEDRTHEYYDLTAENQWIYSQMQEVYLWRDAIKEPSRSTFFSTPSKFFSTLLYSGDKTSFFTDTVSAGSYGMTLAVMRDPIGERPSKVYALVLMVEPGSPADVAGIERGTWISSVDGATFTTTKYTVLQSGVGGDFATEYIEYDDEEQKYYWVPGDTLHVGPSVDYAARAVYLDTIYTVRSKNVGYLVLNNFSGDDFVQQTQDALLRFVANNVDDVIVDLRYCTGGSVANAASLASMFVEPALYGTPFGSLVDADAVPDTTYCYTRQQTTVCDKKLYVVTGARTAGVAELFATAVDKSRSMYDVITFGARSAGVNIVAECIQSPFGFAINPAMHYVTLADGALLAAVNPNFALDELQQVARIYPLGSEQEYMLYNLLYYSIYTQLPDTAN